MLKPYYQDEFATLYHGDCRDVLPQLEPVDLALTDPPYGVRAQFSRGRYEDAKIIGDADASLRDTVLQMVEFRGAYVFGSPKVPKPEGVKATLIWDKGEHVGMGDLQMPWKPNYEEIYVIGTGFQGRRDSSILKFNAVAGCVGRVTSRLHPTEKPVDLLRYLLGKHPAGVVLDPFAGSGSTLRAAKDLGMRAIGIEIEEKYCEIAARRLQQEVFWSAMPSQTVSKQPELLASV